MEQSADGQGLDLVFRSISPSDGGLYACEAEIDSRDERKEFELKVIEPIAFDLRDKVQSVVEGSGQFLLRCNVSGVPRPRVNWNVRGRLVRPGRVSGDCFSKHVLLVCKIETKYMDDFQGKSEKISAKISWKKKLIFQFCS